MPDKTNQTEVKKTSKIKTMFKFLFDAPSWIGIASLMESGHWISSLCRHITNTRLPPVQKETFEEAVTRMNVSTEDLAKQEKAFLRNSIIFLVLAVLSLGYIAYLWHHSSLLVCLAALVVSCLLLLQAYFYSFWYFQIQQKKLGFRFKHWLSWLIKGKV